MARAAERLRGVLRRTGLAPFRTLGERAGCEAYLKPENRQKTGSFKIRGAHNFLSSLDERARAAGVVAASAGNHAQGVARAAARAGLSSTVVMPVRTPMAKVAATRAYGAEVILHGAAFDDCLALARRIEAETGAAFIPAFDDDRVIAGAGTVGREIVTDLPDVDVVVVPVGGGGLISGVGVAVKHHRPGIAVIGVEAERAASVLQSLRAGKRCTVPTVETIADGIAVKRPGERTLPLIRRYVDEVVTVTDDEIAAAISLLLERGKMLAEGAGAAATAALLHGRVGIAGNKAVAVVSGGNIDMNFLSRIIDRGLVGAGVHTRLSTVVADRPGSLQRLLRTIADCGANVLSIHHDRRGEGLSLREAEVDLVLETRGAAQAGQVTRALRSAGYPVRLH